MNDFRLNITKNHLAFPNGGGLAAMAAKKNAIKEQEIRIAEEKHKLALAKIEEKHKAKTTQAKKRNK